MQLAARFELLTSGDAVDFLAGSQGRPFAASASSVTKDTSWLQSLDLVISGDGKEGGAAMGWLPLLYTGISPNLKDEPAKDRRWKFIGLFFSPYESGSWMFLVLQKSLINPHYPIGSMYDILYIYANIWGILMGSMFIYIYSIHGSYGYWGPGDHLAMRRVQCPDWIPMN